ncbi:hypothetical protein G3I01_05875 [Gramella sp. MT6]|uniref:hypothetical protein n=1 Tax=Gramella sp. MT6 TaxID=2705471 RepID=UPI001C5E63B3|nr:hypothetical protein [Gramella sp. MT6]QYA25056.1 hypothetical protein G3I01_05875 [Gramella sp. MT6]
MKAKNLFCLLILVFGFGNITAQEKMHLITLKPEADLNFEFFVTEVQDARQNKGNIGVAQTGLMNKQVPANFSEDFSLHLKAYLNSILPEKQSAQPLIVKVHKLYISERTAAMSELGSCEVSVEFLKSENGKLYSFGTFQSSVEGKGMDVTPKHDDRIKEAINNCINKFTSSNWQNSEIAQEPSEPEDKNEFDSKETLKAGLYFDFEDLVNNSPKQDLPYRTKRILKNYKSEHFQVLQQEKNKRVKNLFGYSDGENVYLNATRYTQSEYFIKSKFIGRYIYFEDQYSSPSATAAFGLIGAAVSNRHTGIVLDTKTGITTVLNNKSMESLLKDYPELLNEYNRSKKTVEDDRKMIEKINNLPPLS